jgi:predicted oxidoreductase
MKKIEISKKVALSAVAQGFWRLDSWGFSTSQLISHMNACIDRGVTTFDTAEIYAGTLCETLMGNAFREDKTLRRRIELVTKTGIFKTKVKGMDFGYYNTTYDRIMQSCKESLIRLGTDHIDLYLIHREDPCFDPWETAQALKDLKKSGMVLEVGVSNFDPFKFDALNQAIEGELATNQIEWNPVCFEHFNSGMMDYLALHKIHPMIWSPLAGGRIFQKDDEKCARAMAKINEIAQRHQADPTSIIYAWIMYHPVGAIPIVGSSNLGRLDLASKAEAIKLDHSEWYEIFTASGQQVLR